MNPRRNKGFFVKNYEKDENGSLKYQGWKNTALNKFDTIDQALKYLTEDFGLEAIGLEKNRFIALTPNLGSLENFSQISKDLPLVFLTKNCNRICLITEIVKGHKKIVPQVKAKSYKPISSYSFYEDGKKFVKVILNLPKMDSAGEKKINVVLKRRMLEVTVDDLEGVNYIFKVTRLHNKYVEDHVSFVVKADKIIVKMEKEDPKDNVFSLYKQKMVGEVPSEDES